MKNIRQQHDRLLGEKDGALAEAEGLKSAALQEMKGSFEKQLEIASDTIHQIESDREGISKKYRELQKEHRELQVQSQEYSMNLQHGSDRIERLEFELQKLRQVQQSDGLGDLEAHMTAVVGKLRARENDIQMLQTTVRQECSERMELVCLVDVLRDFVVSQGLVVPPKLAHQLDLMTGRQTKLPPIAQAQGAHLDSYSRTPSN